ncbi:MAG: ATP-dependent sacrificial sulfur transferase LarE [Candidatus Omnitrophica bacterium]|nr:ATP-dependent sacrificial sulfur transferase LarE [Candidatus Omnitrophota bacterium]
MLKKKLARMVASLKEMQAVLISYSGGVDSSLLLEVARQALGNNVLAVTVDSPVYSKEELEFARRFTAKQNVRHKVIKISHLNNPDFIKNPINRCYYCKSELFRLLRSIAGKSGIKFILDGSNASDLEDFRPGRQAKKEFGIRSPLEECRISKKEVYRLSRIYNLPSKTKPSTVCFASRIPYGQKIRHQDLSMIEEAESYIRSLGIKEVRLRHYNLGASAGLALNGSRCLKLARIEVDKKDIPLLAAGRRRQVIRRLRRLGYNFVALDLEGYRLGSLHQFKHG